jgi:signal transduction histidine kinase
MVEAASTDRPAPVPKGASIWVEMLARLRRNAVALPLAAAGALLVLGISESAYRGATASLASINERDEARLQTQAVLRGLLNAETGQRGYLLTGRKDYLQPYEWAMADIDKALRALQLHYENDDTVRPIVAELAQRSGEKLSELSTVIKLYDEGKPEIWRELTLSNIGKEKMDSIRQSAAALVDIESGRIQREREQVLRTLRLSRIGVNALAAISLLSLFLFLRQTAATDAAQSRHAVALEAERARLEREVARRTAELTELTRHLQTAREDERSHLARELHDELGALLTAAKLDAARLKRGLGTPTPAVEERLSHLSATLDSGIALKRRIIEDLRPSSLSNLGLVAALEIQAREFKQRSEADVITELSPVVLPESAQITVFRLVQEALTNIAKYASASEVRLSMSAADGQVHVSVQDNGQGFDPNAIRASTHGLMGMRYRIESEGGQLRVTAAPGRGTRIEATLPSGDNPAA